MTDSLFDSKWPELPVRLQMFFVFMIADTQRPIYYHGFGMANMKLETFGAVYETNQQKEREFRLMCFYL